MSKTYELVKEFKKKYPSTLYFYRIKKHADLIDKSLHDNEEVIYAFGGQWNEHDGDLFNTAVVALTNERILIAQNRLLGGYHVTSVTPKFYNDTEVEAGVIWGTVRICTMKEIIEIINISKKAVLEIKKTISSFMSDYRKNNPEGIPSETTEKNN